MEREVETISNQKLKTRVLEKWSSDFLKQRPDIAEEVLNFEYIKRSYEKNITDAYNFYFNLTEKIHELLVVEVIDKVTDIIYNSPFFQRAAKAYEDLNSKLGSLSVFEKAFFNSRKGFCTTISMRSGRNSTERTIYRKYIVIDEKDLESDLVSDKGVISIRDVYLSNPDKYFDEETSQKIKDLHLENIYEVPLFGFLWSKEFYNPEGYGYPEGSNISNAFLNRDYFDVEEFNKLYPNASPYLKNTFLKID